MKGINLQGVTDRKVYIVNSTLNIKKNGKYNR